MGTSWETEAVFEEFVPRRPVGSLLTTTRDVLFSPQRYFDWLPADGPGWAPSMYFVICYFITSLINALASLPLLLLPLILATTAAPSETGFSALSILAFSFLILVVYPILTVGFFFAGVAIQHLFIRVVAGRNQRGLLATLRVSCYSVGAAVLVVWIPLVGLVAILYSWYLYTTGLRRVHGISTARAVIAVLIPTILSIALMGVGIYFVFKALQDAFDLPAPYTSYYFPEPEASEDVPPGVIGAAALMDGNPDQGQVKNLREGSYSDVPPGAESGAIVYFVSADPKDRPRGVEGFASDGEGETLSIKSEPAKDRQGKNHIAYYGSESVSKSPTSYYKERVVQPGLAQGFALSSGLDYAVEVDQVGAEPRIIRVQTYDSTDMLDGKAYFYVPYRTTEPGTRLKIQISPGEPLDRLRLKIDRDADGSYEESWMPEATVAGPAAGDTTQPHTEAYLQEPSDGNGPLLVLTATDDPVSEDVAPSSGVGVIYYWINDSGPRIYNGPLHVKTGDVVTYWAIDRAGNLEWRRTTDIRIGPSKAQESKSENS